MRSVQRWGGGLAVAASIFGAGCGSNDAAPDARASRDALLDLDAEVPLDAEVLLDAEVPLDAADPDAGGRRAAVQPTRGAADLMGASDLSAPVPPGRSRAGRVDADAERLTGPEANCRIGDFRLDNARVHTCIQDTDTFSIFSFGGGTLIDAHRADRPGSDLLLEVIFSPGLGAPSAEQVGIVRDGSDGGPAILRVVGRALPSRLLQGVLPGAFLPPDFAVTTEFVLFPDSDAVEINTWIEADVTGGSALLADAVFFGDRTTTLIPGRRADEQPLGDLPWLAADGPGAAYRYEALDGSPIQLVPVPADALPTSPVSFGTQGLFRGDQVVIRRRLVIGADDIESVRPAPPDAPLTTLVGPAGAWIGITDLEDREVTRVRLDATGRGRVALSPGRWRWRLVDEPTRPAGELEAGGEVALDAPERGQVRVTTRDQNGVGIAARVELIRDDGERRLDFIVDAGTMRVPPGRWRAVTTRGWYFDADERTLDVPAGGDVTLDVVLTEVIPFEGWTTGEFHQHASPSIDSEVAVERRVLSNLAEGVGFFAPSEHDVVYDFRPVVERMGLSDRVRVLTGTEISPLYGHFGAYGLEPRPDASGFGAIVLPVFEGGRWRVKQAPELVADARARGAEVLQINHAREGTSAYFDHIGLVAGAPLELLDPVEFTRDFDTMEVFNEPSAFCRLFEDWLSVWNQGWRITAVGNSDTHSEGGAPGYPRNVLPTLADRPEGVEPGEVFDALRGGRVVVSGGLVLDFPGSAGPGEVRSLPAGTLELRTRIRSPRWARAERIFVFVNGQLALEQAVDVTDEQVTDFDDTLRVPVDRDAWVVVLATGPALRFIAPGAPAFAFSNPIGVDVDGGGVSSIGPGPVQRPTLAVCD